MAVRAKYRRGVAVSCALVMLGLVAWLSCGGDDEGPKPITSPCQELGKLERFRYTYRYRIHSPQPEGPVDETQLGDPPFAIPPTGETFSFEQIYEGSFVAPDRYQIEVRTPSEQRSASIQLLFIANEAFIASNTPEGTVWRPEPGSTNTF